MLEFQNAPAFLLLLCVPLYYFLRAAKILKSVSFAITLSDWGGKSFDWHGKTTAFFSVLAEILVILGFIAVVLALADPVVSHEEKIYTSRGTDIMFVIDVSPSMAARDMGGLTRLEAAKNSIQTLFSEDSGSTFGVVALASEAAVVVPSTGDREFFLDMLDKISVGLLGDGSALGTGISTAVYHLMSSRAPVKCIILITDGENNAGAVNPETAARLAQANGIVLHVLAVGTKGTVQLEYTDTRTGKQYSGYLDSNFDVSALRKLSEAGNGGTFEIQSLAALNASLKNIENRVSTAQTFYTRKTTEKYYHVFLILAVLLLAASWIFKRVLLREVV